MGASPAIFEPDLARAAGGVEVCGPVAMGAGVERGRVAEPSRQLGGSGRRAAFPAGPPRHGRSSRRESRSSASAAAVARGDRSRGEPHGRRNLQAATKAVVCDDSVNGRGRFVNFLRTAATFRKPETSCAWARVIEAAVVLGALGRRRRPARVGALSRRPKSECHCEAGKKYFDEPRGSLRALVRRSRQLWRRHGPDVRKGRHGSSGQGAESGHGRIFESRAGRARATGTSIQDAQRECWLALSQAWPVRRVAVVAVRR